MTQQKPTKQNGPTQADNSTDDVVLDTGWQEYSGVQVRLVVAGGERSLVRKKWFETMIFPIQAEEEVA